MNNIFENIFSNKADDTSNGYYFYKVEDEFYEDEKDYSGDFKDAWNCRKLQEVFETTHILEQIIDEIANENKPFLEISCGKNMGLVSFIVKRNPKIQCLVTDINDTIINGWHKFINDHSNKLHEYRISLARFDNCNIPIKDNSFDWITCTFALNYLYNINKDKFEKALKEIHRLLKKGGRLVAIEHTCNLEYDREKVFQECQLGGKLYGLFSYEEMEQIYKEFHDEKLQREQFTSPGFKIEVGVDGEGKDIKRYSNAEAFSHVVSISNGKCTAFAKSNGRYNQILNLKKSSPYLGIKYTLEKYLLVLRKL